MRVIKTLGVLVLIVLCFELLLIIINNTIADRIRLELMRIPAPNSSSIIESISIAGKIQGCGNGIQYTGALLIASNSSLKQIKDHYSAYSRECEIIHLEHSELARYFHNPTSLNTTCYIVSITRDVESGGLQESIIYDILSSDFRAH